MTGNVSGNHVAGRDSVGRGAQAGGRGKRGLFALLLAALLLACLVSASVGAAGIGPGVVAAMIGHRLGLPVRHTWDVSSEAIVFLVRLPRVALAVLVGSALAACGAAFQGLFRNAMADPYVLGVSPGAALGAALAIVLKMDVSFLGISAVPLFAFAGGVLTAGTVYSLARIRGTLSVESLLLTGIAVGSLLSALTTLVIVRYQRDLNQVYFWTLGGLSARTWTHVTMVIPYWLVGVGIVVFSMKELNLMTLGEEDAYHLGVNTETAKTRILLAASLAASSAVAAAGVVGFVGLMVPHIVRLVTGPDHRVFLPATIIGGAVAVLAADIAARTVLSPEEIPLGVVTALMGAPFFLYLLRRKEARR